MSNKVAGIIARFGSSGDLMRAAEKTRDAGYRKFDCHSPFPIHGMDKAMGLGRSNLGWIVGASAIIGASGALLLQWYASTIAYPLVISGKPFFSFQAYVPVTFALGVLFSAFTAMLGMLILNGLPRFYHPVFYSDKFKRVTDDGFFISVMSDDPKFSAVETGKFLESIGGKDIEPLRENQ